jgi:threonine/homoserine/homoserine lactone efflux protein
VIIRTLVLFSATVLPLVFTPGPDILFIVSQALSRGRSAALRANLGILAGYAVHGILAAFGVAALVAASPLLFNTLRWIGVAYIGYLAVKLLRSALKAGQPLSVPHAASNLFSKGFLTSFFNPKGLMVFLSLLPQFIDPAENVAEQAVVLSLAFIALCGAVYALVGVVSASLFSAGTLNDRQRRCVEGVSGGLLLVAAGRMASR